MSTQPLSLLIKEWRINAKMSQTALGKNLGYGSGQFISNWERGVSYPPMDKLAMMVKLFKLNKRHVFNLYINEIVEVKHREYKESFK